MKLKYVKASYTIEISFLLGIILFIIFSVLYLAFWSHDRLQLSYTLRKTALWGISKIEQGEVITETELIDQARKEQGLLFCIDNIVYSSQIQRGVIIMAYGGTNEIPFWQIEKLITGEGNVEFQIKTPIDQPEAFLRRSHLFREEIP